LLLLTKAIITPKQKLSDPDEFTKCHHMPKQESHHHHKAQPAEKNKLQELLTGMKW
jgi:hypothetical protein